jgi:NADPH2:quinone reductase
MTTTSTARMLAATYDRSGPSDVIHVDEVPRPDAGAGEVRVRVRYSGVNPTDWKARAGTDPASGGFQIPNQDGVGTIDQVGLGVDESRIGERVWVRFAAWQRPYGTAAQWTVVPQENAVVLPDGASDELGASLGIPAMTAHRLLFADGPLDTRTVLVAGGAGAVGHAAIALARWAGAHVITTVSSPEKAQLARAAGAHEVVDYRDEDAVDQLRTLAPDGIDRVAEVSLAANLDLDLQVCAPRAVISSYADDGGGEPALPIRRLMTKNLELRFVLVYTMGPAATAAATHDITRILADGALPVQPLHRFPLEETARAHDAVADGAVGKVLIEVPR